MTLTLNVQRTLLKTFLPTNQKSSHLLIKASHNYSSPFKYTPPHPSPKLFCHDSFGAIQETCVVISRYHCSFQGGIGRTPLPHPYKSENQLFEKNCSLKITFARDFINHFPPTVRRVLKV